MITKATRCFGLLGVLFALVAALVVPVRAADADTAKPTDLSLDHEQRPVRDQTGRTHNAKYLSYIQNWVDTYVDADGDINSSFNSLDSMQAGNLLVLLYQQTKQARYKTLPAAAVVMNEEYHGNPSPDQIPGAPPWA